MKVLVACEYSGIVRDAFIKKGHNAISCDILPSESDLGEHYQGDVMDILNDDWDLMIAHPPCTHLSVSGARWFTSGHKPMYLRDEAIEFVRTLMEADIEKICIENPISVIASYIRKSDQLIHPYHFGQPVQKSTCLWLKNLPKLKHTKVVDPEFVKSGTGRIWSKWFWETSLLPANERSKARSKFWTGIAKAMASQWGEIK
jgi:hypothetical protein